MSPVDNPIDVGSVSQDRGMPALLADLIIPALAHVLDVTEDAVRARLDEALREDAA